MRIIGRLTFVLLFLSGFAWGQQATYDKKCTAIVQGQTAQFIFPLPKRQDLDVEHERNCRQLSRIYLGNCLGGQHCDA